MSGLPTPSDSSIPERAPTEFAVFVDLSLRKEIRVYSSSPELAAERAVEMVRAAYPEERWDVRAGQVDYFTEHGGESHWYPR